MRDVVVSAILLALLSPLLLVIGLLIRLESPGPALFRQIRGGRFQQPFVCFKFRTLKVMENAENVRQVTAGDPRITRVGAFLRRTCLDELPQLINVLRGDMSLVGPRPHALQHDRHFVAIIPEYRRRFGVRPGMTGMAQVMGLRGEIDQPSKLSGRLIADLAYVEDRNFWLDLKILLLTPAEILGLAHLEPPTEETDPRFDANSLFAKIAEKEL